MKLKELLRVIITGEMEDISVYEVEADVFGELPGHGAAIRKLFIRLAGEKRDRLKMLHRISKDGVGFRQRRTEAARSIEASLRTHAFRAERSAVLYSDLKAELTNADFKLAVEEMAAAERGFAKELKDLQALIKRP